MESHLQNFTKTFDMDIENLIHKDPVTVDPRPGNMLVAGPMLSDINFSRTAVLILDRPDNAGHLGLVLNRETDYTLDILLEDCPGADKIHLFIGGPVELDRMFMLHRLGNVIDHSIELMPGLYAGGNPDQIKDYIASGEQTDGKIRFFMGYSGWGEEQLAKEIIEHTWAVNIKPDIDNLLRGSGQEYWRRQVKDLGPGYRSWLNIPGHPQMN